MATPAQEQLFMQSPLRFLTGSSFEALSNKLDRRKLLPSADGTCRDWRGLAEKAGFTRMDMEAFENRPRPTIELIKRWCKRDGVTVFHLTDALSELDRDDVIHDVGEAMATDCEKALNQVTVTNAAGVSQRLEDIRMDEDVLTLQDQECRQNGRPLVKYDAMLIYATDEIYKKGHPLQGQPLPESERSDVFAAHLRERMESAGLQVYDPKTDLLAGNLELASSVDIINRRVKKVILICTPDLLESREAEYLWQVAEHTAVEQATKMILPIMFKECPKERLPAAIRIVTKLPFKPKLAHVNFYKRLIVDTLRAPNKNISVEYPQMYLADQTAAAAAANHNHVSASPLLLHQRLAVDPSSDTQSTVFSVRSDISDTFTNLTVQTTLSETDSVITTNDGAQLIAPRPPTHEPGGATAAERQPQSKGLRHHIQKKVAKIKKAVKT